VPDQPDQIVADETTLKEKEAAPTKGGLSSLLSANAILFTIILGLLGFLCTILATFLVATDHNVTALRQEMNALRLEMNKAMEPTKGDHDAGQRLELKFSLLVDQLNIQTSEDFEEHCRANKGTYDGNRFNCSYANNFSRTWHPYGK